MSPLLPVMWQIPDENGRMVDSENWSYGSVRNPLAGNLWSGMEERKTRVLNGIFNADLKIIDGLNHRYAVLCKYIYPPRWMSLTRRCCLITRTVAR